MLPPHSIFREMPVGLPASIKRLMSGLAYAYDSADLAYSRLRKTAQEFYVPGSSKEERTARCTPERRLAVIADAWSCIDNLARLRAIVRQFPLGEPPPAEVAPFLTGSDAVRLMRNRGQHLDEDYANGENFNENNPVLGTVTWVDARYPDGDLRTAVASGSAINPTGGARVGGFRIREPNSPDDVSCFELMAFDRQLDVDEAMRKAALFVAAFEETVEKSVKAALHAGATVQGVPVGPLLVIRPCDLVFSMAFRKDGERWIWLPDESIGKTEVAPRGGDVVIP